MTDDDRLLSVTRGKARTLTAAWIVFAGCVIVAGAIVWHGWYILPRAEQEKRDIEALFKAVK